MQSSFQSSLGRCRRGAGPANGAGCGSVVQCKRQDLSEGPLLPVLNLGYSALWSGDIDVEIEHG